MSDMLDRPSREPTHREQTISRLQTMLTTWRASGRMPTGAGALSSGEYSALLLAHGEESLRARRVVGDFVALDGWLQRWVLETWGWPSMVGQRLGVD